MSYTESIFRSKTQTLWAIYLNQTGTECILNCEQLPEIPNYESLLEHLNFDTNSVRVADLRKWGFNELVEEMNVKFFANNQNRFQKLKDDESIDLMPKNKNFYWLYLTESTLLSRILAYKINKILPSLYKKNIIDFGMDYKFVKDELIKYNKYINNYWNSKKGIEEELKSMKQKWTEISNKEFREGHFNTEIKIDNRPFLSLSMGIISSEYKMRSPIGFENPKWSIHLLSNSFSVQKNKRLIESPESPKDIDGLIHMIFHMDNDETRSKICTIVKDIFNTELNNNDICYDFISESYFLTEKEEENLIKSILPQKASDQITEVARYTTFETAFEILKNRTIRMNSVISMNDKSETDFLPELVSNFEDNAEVYDKILLADQKFISSFTTKVDDLDMWRLYGDNAHGICLVFKRSLNDNLYKISYIDPESSIIKEMNSFMSKLKDEKIQFKFALFQKYRHYMKHHDYKSEDEYRFRIESNKCNGWYINRENNILTPFITKELKKSLDDENLNAYPFYLYKIILGPSTVNSFTNLAQFYKLIEIEGYDEMVISTSSIESYR